ncbi:MAG: peroxidase [Mucilaginibacter sp.]|nr:peroxidase [Mucilaginibacter sp.]
MLQQGWCMQLCIVNNDEQKITTMARLKALNPDEATGKTKELFNVIQSKLGVVPNMMRTMGNSPALLQSYLNLNDTLAHGILGAKNGELLALAISENNSCNYCVSAHSYIGEKLVHIDANTLVNARNGKSADAKTDAALKFANTLVDKKGLVNDSDVDTVKAAGFTDGEIGEIVGHVALNILTNYFNNTADTEIDFPVTKPLPAIEA